MNQPTPSGRTAARALVDALEIHEVDTVFCVPGESYLAVLDALHGSANAIRTIACRQEGGAAFMAEAYGKLTGKPGVAMVTRGPGACNASIGVHTGFQDSTPMVIFIGQVGRDQEYREAFQELDYRRFYGELCKGVVQVDRPERVPELVSQAFHVATSGRPGPVAVALPEDMLHEVIEAADTGPYQAAEPGADPRDLAALADRLQTAAAPLMIVGGGGWSAEAVADITRFAERFSLPVAASLRCQDRFDNAHPCYAGDFGLAPAPALSARLRDCDLLIAVGPRLGEMTTQGYSNPVPPVPPMPLVHVHPDPEELGRVYRPALPICASVGRFARAAAALEPRGECRWQSWTREAHADYEAYFRPTEGLPGRLDMGEVMMHLDQRLPDDAILTTDAGNFSGWMHRHYRYRRFPTQLGPTNGAMGYGIPAAVAARLVHPDRPAVAFCGDGGALMSGQEIATALQYGADPVILVVNNNMYGTIRAHQERHYPGRVVATALENPDFVAWAGSFGAHAERVEETAQFPDALERALAAGRAAVIELRIDPELISTRGTLSSLSGAG